MHAEFEEKQYEQHLNIELLQGSNLIFPPGQHLENVLGFDAALFTRNKNFWRHFLGGYPWYRRFFKNYLNGMYFPQDAYELEDAFNNDFPQFKFNAFIQHKRPERMIKHTASEWLSWHQDYYRYKVMDHQQATLIALEKHIGNNGIVTYASPAFHTKQEFWDTHKSQAFIKNSNFCQPSKLINHKAYTYINSGTHGIAHSEPEKVESKHILHELERLSGQEYSEDIKNTDFISNTCEIIEASIKGQGKLTALYHDIVNDLDESQKETPKLLHDLYRLSVFKFVSGTSLCFGVGNEGNTKIIQETNRKIHG